MELYLLRHGQAMFGSKDYDRLSDLGHKQALCLGDELGQWQLSHAKLMTGALKRQQQTFAGVHTGLGERLPEQWLVDANADAGLNEINVAELMPVYWPQACARLGLDISPQQASEQVHQFMPLLSEAIRLWMDDGQGQVTESFEQFQQRVLTALTEHGDHNSPTLAVTSGGVISLMTALATGDGPRPMAELIHQVNNCSITHLKYARGQWHLQAFNINGHLRRQQMLTWR